MPTTFLDAYAVLGVSRDATTEQIKAAYKHLMKLHHPDRNGGSDDAKRRAQDINAAHRILSSPLDRRALDDELRRRDREGSGPSQDDVERLRREREAAAARAREAAERARRSEQERLRREREAREADAARIREAAERARREREMRQAREREATESARREREAREARAREEAEHVRLKGLRKQRIANWFAALVVGAALGIGLASAEAVAAILGTSAITVRYALCAMAVALAWLSVESRGFKPSSSIPGRLLRPLRFVALGIVVFALAVITFIAVSAAIPVILGLLATVVQSVIVIAVMFVLLAWLVS